MACGGLAPVAPVGPTLSLSNQGVGQVVLRDRSGRLATVLPGETRCVTLRQTETPQALVVTSQGRSYETPLFIPAAEAGWQLVIGTEPRYDVIRLIPSEGACNPYARRGKAKVTS